MTSAIVSPTHIAELARQQLVLADDPRQDRDPGRAEEDRDRRHRGRRAGRRAARWSRAAIGMSSTTAARRRSLTTSTSLWSQRSTNVPAIGAEQQVRERGRDEDERARQRRAGRRPGPTARERDLVDPVAEERDQLAGPERRERAVERQADVRVAADAGHRLRRGPGMRSTEGGRLGGRSSASPVALDRPVGNGAERRGGEARAPAPPRTTGRSRAAVSVRAGARPVSGAIVVARRPRESGRRRAPGQALADRGLLVLLELVGTRTTLANRKNARPSVRNTSPSEATFWTNGSGIGMTSPRIRRWSRKSRRASPARRRGAPT